MTLPFGCGSGAGDDAGEYAPEPSHAHEVEAARGGSQDGYGVD
jgi:hypothetical protein